MTDKSDADADLRILRQETGRFDHRFAIGPAIWPHFDLLWLHEGSVELFLGQSKAKLSLTAPNGVLIFPNVPFRGHARDGAANASICHFEWSPAERPDTPAVGYRLPGSNSGIHGQHLVGLSQSYARREIQTGRRVRLLRAILDLFESDEPEAEISRLERAWEQASLRLDRIRSLSDVADILGLQESSFRALHREEYGGSAGQHLKELRLRETERRLASTGETIAEIAAAVGYAHPESMTAAFKQSRGQTPLAYRNWCRRFA